MNEVNQTLYIPLYGKARVSRQGIILKDAMAETIWDAERFPIRGKSRSKWLTYNMAMRARVFDDWTESCLQSRKDALVLHIGCGLDARCLRVNAPYARWIDADLEDVIRLRRKYFAETERYHMMSLDASDSSQIAALQDSADAVVVLEGLSMYLTNDQVHGLLGALARKYAHLRVLMDVYTHFGAKASKYKNPVNDVGVTALHGIEPIESVLGGTGLCAAAEHSFTPKHLIDQLKPMERAVFRMLFSPKLYGKIYRLYELSSN